MVQENLSPDVPKTILKTKTQKKIQYQKTKRNKTRSPFLENYV
jgi:hypothetical protein